MKYIDIIFTTLFFLPATLWAQAPKTERYELGDDITLELEINDEDVAQDHHIAMTEGSCKRITEPKLQECINSSPKTIMGFVYTYACDRKKDHFTVRIGPMGLVTDREKRVCYEPELSVQRGELPVIKSALNDYRDTPSPAFFAWEKLDLEGKKTPAFWVRKNHQFLFDLKSYLRDGDRTSWVDINTLLHFESGQCQSASGNISTKLPSDHTKNTFDMKSICRTTQDELFRVHLTSQNHLETQTHTISVIDITNCNDPSADDCEQILFDQDYTNWVE
ncbi:MAG: hypothetical protein R3A45_02295 [Bdellovibrionota bacterium]